MPVCLYTPITVVFESETITVSKGETLVFPPNTAYRILVDKYGMISDVLKCNYKYFP